MPLPEQLAMYAYAVVTVLTVAVVGWLLRRLIQRRCDPSPYPKDKVIMFHLGRGPGTPSISPFSLKLETFLRMAKIPYQAVSGHKMSSKGKSPWMIFQGTVVADSQFCIEHLNKKLDIDLNSHLSEEERATARAFQKMTEENLYWTMCASSFGDDLSGVTKVMPYNRVANWLMARYLRHILWREMWGHGIGRHHVDDIRDIGVQDMRALSALLGGKPFMFGQEPCETDCAIFGMLAQALWHMQGTFPTLMTTELRNLADYCERMRDRYWPDWDEYITHGGTRKARE